MTRDKAPDQSNEAHIRVSIQNCFWGIGAAPWHPSDVKAYEKESRPDIVVMWNAVFPLIEVKRVDCWTHKVGDRAGYFDGTFILKDIRDNQRDYLDRRRHMEIPIYIAFGNVSDKKNRENIPWERKNIVVIPWDRWVAFEEELGDRQSVYWSEIVNTFPFCKLGKNGFDYYIPESSPLSKCIPTEFVKFDKGFKMSNRYGG